MLPTERPERGTERNERSEWNVVTLYRVSLSVIAQKDISISVASEFLNETF